MPAEVESMFSVRKVPWHGMGKVVKDSPSSQNALRLSELDWRVSKRSISVCVAPGLWVAETGHVAVVRESDHRVLGIVSPRYEPIQNEEAFEFVDQLLGGGEVTYETAGSLWHGEVVWLLAKMRRRRTIFDDDIEPYLLFANGHNGHMSVKVLMTPVRVVCANTLNLALRGARRTWTATHIGDLRSKMSMARETLRLADSYMDRLEKEADNLFRIAVDENRWESIVDRLLPIPPGSNKIRKRNIGLLRNDLRRRRQAPDLRNFAWTGWGSLNAVADHVDHVPSVTVLGGREGYDPDGSLADTRFYDVVTGHRMLDKAAGLIKRLG